MTGPIKFKEGKRVDFKLDLLKLKTAKLTKVMIKLTKVMISDIDFKPSEGMIILNHCSNSRLQS